MGQLVLLLVAAAWAAVLIPPLLRSRIENRPNNSVSDFRDQLSSLQQTVPGGNAVQMRSMGRSLVGSPLERPAAAGRPDGQVASHTDGSLKSISINQPVRVEQPPVVEGERGPRRRRRPSPPQSPQTFHDPLLELQAERRQSAGGGEEAPQKPQRQRSRQRPENTASHGERRQRQRQHRSHGKANSRQAQQRRRSNVLFVLALVACCSLFLALTTEVTAAIYVFVLSFLALGGYVYMLGQTKQNAGGAAAPAGGPGGPRGGGDPVRRATHHRRSAPARASHEARAPRRRRPADGSAAAGERWLDIA